MIINCIKTIENLKAAFAGESMAGNRYTFCSNLAFTGNKKENEERWLVHNNKNKTVFTKEKPIVWVCGKCGHIHVGISAPIVCPVCRHSEGYSEVKTVNYY